MELGSSVFLMHSAIHAVVMSRNAMKAAAVTFVALMVFAGGLGRSGADLLHRRNRGLFGLVGAVWGVLIIVCALLLRSMPQNHVGLGIAVIIFALFSWVGSFGGFVIGFLLALVGGILAIVWKP